MRSLKIIISILAVLFVYRLYVNNNKYPILQAYKSKESSNMWLTTTIMDFYLQVVAFSIFVYYNESNKKHAFAWIASNCILGSPSAIVYLVLKFSK